MNQSILGNVWKKSLIWKNVSAILGIGFPKTVHYILRVASAVGRYILPRSISSTFKSHSGNLRQWNRKNTSLSWNPKHRVSPFEYQKNSRNFLWKKKINLDSLEKKIEKERKLHKILPHIPPMPARAQYLAYSGRPSQKLSIVPPKANNFQKSSPGIPPGGGGENRGVQLSEMEKMGIVNSLIHQSSKSGGWNHQCQVIENWPKFIRDCWRSPLYNFGSRVRPPFFERENVWKTNMTS